MTDPQKKLLIGAAATVALLLSLWLDQTYGGAGGSEDLETLANAFSFIGNGLFLAALCAGLYAIGRVLWNKKLKDAAGAGLNSIILSSAVVHILKAAFERPRAEHSSGAMMKLLENPSFFDITGRFNSFPSGHATVSFALAYVLSRKYPSLSVFFYAVAALVGASRVYLGSHYPSDVAAGAMVGIAAGWLVCDNMHSRKKWLAAGLALLIVTVSFFKTGSFLLFDIDEAVFSEASREMAETGDLVTPTYNYEPRYDKPILIYWLMSASFSVFGTNEFAARFTSSFFGAMLVFMTFFFVRRLKGDLPAYLSALALLLNVEYFVYTHSAVTDMTLAFFITASIFSFYLLYHEGKRVWLAAFWVSAALAALTKGAVGILFPMAVAFLYLLAAKDARRFRILLNLKYIILFLLISVPWFALQLQINGWDFFNAFVIKHHIQRYSGVISSHGGPVYYYILVLLAGFFPWVAFLPSAIYRGLRKRLDPDNGLYLLCAVWFLFVLVFFSAAGTKLPNYIFPLFPPAAVMAGLYASQMIEDGAKKHALYIILVLSAVLSAALFLLPDMGFEMEVALPHWFFYSLSGIFLAIALMALTAFARPLGALLGVSALMAALILVLRLYGLPPVNLYLQKTLYDYSLYARGPGKDAVVATYELNKPSVAFYAEKKVIKMEKKAACDITEYGKRSAMLIITEASRHNELREYGLDVIDTDGRYMLLTNDPALPPYSK